MNTKKLKVLKVVNTIVLIIAIALLATGIYECIFAAIVYDGSGSFNKSDAVIAYAVTYGVSSAIFWGVFFIIKSKIKKYDKLDD
ncbi:hypothetical protein [uncultured Eubacterium sp.]|uniref:hypothetical protein n=1 Tax=uncultured Eubacterium sp. TaxID=165185 RepID=UPI002582BF77|nr:hypothetical protein [uncultured Eubacterium sp.]